MNKWLQLLPEFSKCTVVFFLALCFFTYLILIAIKRKKRLQFSKYSVYNKRIIKEILLKPNSWTLPRKVPIHFVWCKAQVILIDLPESWFEKHGMIILM